MLRPTIDAYIENVTPIRTLEPPSPMMLEGFAALGYDLGD